MAAVNFGVNLLNHETWPEAASSTLVSWICVLFCLLCQRCIPTLPGVCLQDIEKQVLQEQQAAFMSEVEQWSQGEVEAIQAAAATRLQEEQAATQRW